jgi:hypothetical protein
MSADVHRPVPPVRVQVPAEPPVLTPLAAQALLRLLLELHNRPLEDQQTTLAWDRTA